MSKFTIEDPIEQICACRNCGHGPTGHGDPDGHCLFHPGTVYFGTNDLMDWEFWTQLKQMEQTMDEVRKVNELVAKAYPGPRFKGMQANPRYSDRMTEVIHQIAKGKR